MAILKMGPIVAALRGTVAGITFSANASGPFARGWSKGANPKSALQTNQRGRLGAIAAAWRDLTQVQRDDWIVYAALPAQDRTNSLGETFSASGFNWFVKINDQLEAAGEARRVDAPTLTRLAQPIYNVPGSLFFTTEDPLPSRLRWTGPSPGRDGNYVLACRVTTQGVSALASNFVFIVIAIPDAEQKIFIQDELEAAFGTIVLAQRLFVHTRGQDAHGQRSPLSALTLDAQT